MITTLQNIKVAIFDFDNTLAIHRNGNYVEDRKSDEDGYFLEAYENPQNFFETIEPCTENTDMKNLVSYCRNENIPMFCVTGMKFSLHMPAKAAFIKKHYGDDIELIVSAGQEHKPDVVRILMRHFGITPEQVLFVDDMQTTLDILNHDTGIVGVHLSEVKELKTRYGNTLAEYMDNSIQQIVPQNN